MTNHSALIARSGWRQTQSGVWLRSDGVEVNAYGGGRKRPWQAIRGTTEFLRKPLYAGSDVLGGVRTFATADAAIAAVDEAWPLRTLAVT